jgi:hypothetical protein
MSNPQWFPCTRCGWSVPAYTAPITALQEHWARDHGGVPAVKVIVPLLPHGIGMRVER